MEYRVRSGFVLHLGDRPPIPGGAIVSLTAAEFERHAHQLEPVAETDIETEIIPAEVPAQEVPLKPPDETEGEPKQRSRKKKEIEE